MTWISLMRLQGCYPLANLALGLPQHSQNFRNRKGTTPGDLDPFTYHLKTLGPREVP